MMVPTVLAMVVCDAVWRDPDTGKATLAGAIVQIAGEDLPVERAQVCVYAQLSGHQGWVTLRFSLYGADVDGLTDASAPLASTEAPVHFANRAAVADVLADLIQRRFPGVRRVPLPALRGW